MKKIILISFAFVSVLAFTSCNKDYTCSCTFPSNTTKNFDVKLTSMRHNDAKVMCTDYSTFIDSTSMTEGTCILK